MGYSLVPSMILKWQNEQSAKNKNENGKGILILFILFL
jgi:hypothetical protein